MQILVGKAVPSIVIGLVQSTIILLIIRFWFQIPMNGSYWLLYLGLLSFTGAGVGLGLSISAVSVTMQQAMLYTFLIIMQLKIGRASCRERVCQYVQISVVAASCKNKDTTNRHSATT